GPPRLHLRRVGRQPGCPLQAVLLHRPPARAEGARQGTPGHQPRRGILRDCRPRHPPPGRADPRRGSECDRSRCGPSRGRQPSRDHTMKKLIFFLTALWSGGTIGVWYWNDLQGRHVEFRTVRVERGDLLTTIDATGTIEPEEVVDVGA